MAHETRDASRQAGGGVRPGLWPAVGDGDGRSCNRRGDLRRSHALQWAAVLAFYALISVFPLLLLLLLAATWAVDPT